LGPELHSLHQLPTGELRAVGRFAETGNDRVFVGGTDSIGRFAWLRRYGGVDSRSSPASSFITKQGGLLVAAGTAGLEPYPGGFWLFELPTPNGMIDFAPTSGALTTTLTTESTDACLTIADAPNATVPVPVVQRLVEVHANEVTPGVREQ
jgi:hypothetical protein